MNKQTCPFCGIETDTIDGPTHRYLASTPGCWHIYTKILAKEYGDMRFFALHDLTVDTYALQHPGTKSSQTIQSEHIHLTSLYAFFKLKYDTSSLSQVKQLVARDKSTFHWLTPPNNMSAINISIIHEKENVDEYLACVQKWAYYVFEQWSYYHDIAQSHISKLNSK